MSRLPYYNLVGQRFGKLRVLSYEGRPNGNDYGDSLWKVECDCGVVKVTKGYSLRAGLSTTCGCGTRQALLKVNTTHGKTRTVEYRLWVGMQTRCYNKKEKAYKYYGARGIRVCVRWLGDGGFVNFLADMGERPSAKHWIERKNNDRNYEPSNCCWATREVQANNKRNTIWVTWEGKKMSLKQACGKVRLPYYSVRSRMYRKGWSFQQAVRNGWRVASLKTPRG